MRKNNFGVEIIVDGQPLEEHEHSGRIYVAAPWGSKYAIRFIVRDDGESYQAVCSVDGLNITTGQPVSTCKGDSHIVTAPSHPTDNDLATFRINDTEGAPFEFDGWSYSYAEKLRQPNNTGVIAVAYFQVAKVHVDVAPTHRGQTIFKQGEMLALFVLQYAPLEKLIQFGIIRSN